MEKEKQKHFVKTKDPDVAKQLREAGFIELAKEGNRFVFINEINKIDRLNRIDVLNFENKDIHYDDKLMFWWSVEIIPTPRIHFVSLFLEVLDLKLNAVDADTKFERFSPFVERFPYWINEKSKDYENHSKTEHLFHNFTSRVRIAERAQGGVWLTVKI